jgi:hypothetical protein
MLLILCRSSNSRTDVILVGEMCDSLRAKLASHSRSALPADESWPACTEV